jgi:hypothetical protein
MVLYLENLCLTENLASIFPNLAKRRNVGCKATKKTAENKIFKILKTMEQIIRKFVWDFILEELHKCCEILIPKELSIPPQTVPPIPIQTVPPIPA